MAFTSVGAEVNFPLEMVHTFARYVARYNIWSYSYMEMRQIGQNMVDFILSILLKQ
jgi:hypothetical protein